MSMQDKLTEALGANLAETIIKVVVASRGGMLAPEAMHKIGALAGLIHAGHAATTGGATSPLERMAAMPNCPDWLKAAAEAARGGKA